MTEKKSTTPAKAAKSKATPEAVGKRLVAKHEEGRRPIGGFSAPTNKPSGKPSEKQRLHASRRKARRR